MKTFRVLLLLLGLTLTACDPVHDNGGSVNAFMNASSCEGALMVEYKAKVYPFFRSSNTCLRCHIEGGQGLGTFASANVQASFNAFQAAGVSKISYMATNPAHKPPYTGTQNSAAVNEWSTSWNTSQNLYMDCLAKSQNGGVNESLLTAAKPAPRIYSGARNVQTLTWELDKAADVDPTTHRSVPVRVTIDVAVLYQNGLAAGYIFSNPTMQMKDTTKEAVVEGIFFQINNLPIPSQTTFTNVSRVIRGPQVFPLMTANANTLVSPLATTDVFQLYFRRVALTSGAEDAPPPLTPILAVSDRDTNNDLLIKSTQARVSILRDSGVIRWCLSESPVPPASTDDICVSSATGTGVINGWRTSRPTSYDFTPGDGQKSLYLWVANQSLKINAEPAIYTVTLDTTAPAPANIDSIMVSDTQVGAMTLSHPNEPDVAGWCVIEQNVLRAQPGRPNLDNECWRWTDNGVKPTTVGFKGGGSRDVYVFVRDQAGNVSTVSNVVNSNNPYGAITFSQLTSNAGGPRAIFYNRCYTCHGTNTNPGFNKLQLFNFGNAAEAADTGVLVSRINNEISPMPNVNGGLMPQVERDLIRLWTMPEEGDDPLP